MWRAGRPDPIGIIEAAYTWDPDEASWLQGIVQAMSPYAVGGGVIASTIQVSDHAEVHHTCKSESAAAEHVDALRSAIESFPAPLAHEVFAPTEFVGNSAFRLSRIARSVSGSRAALVRRTRDHLPPLWALVSGDTRRRTLVACFPAEPQHARSEDEPFPHRDARSLGLVGAHLAAALRLRAIVQPEAADGAEAILTPGGKLLHATGRASSSSARRSLVEAVTASTSARGQMRHTAPEEALDLWTALVQGRWSIIDVFERDGNRLLLARRNPLHEVGLLELTAEERDVAWLAACGHSYKYIGYQLGIPLSTASGRLRSAMSKLRVHSRAELLRKLGTT